MRNLIEFINEAAKQKIGPLINVFAYSFSIVDFSNYNKIIDIIENDAEYNDFEDAEEYYSYIIENKDESYIWEYEFCDDGSYYIWTDTEDGKTIEFYIDSGDLGQSVFDEQQGKYFPGDNRFDRKFMQVLANEIMNIEITGLD